jgi:hypothetical protein
MNEFPRGEHAQLTRHPNPGSAVEKQPKCAPLREDFAEHGKNEAQSNMAIFDQSVTG